jgi:hypothetical protein
VLQRLNSFDLDEELLPSDGVYSRDQLEEMDRRFVEAVERAFALKLESPIAAAATVSFRNGRAVAVEAAIEGAFNFLCAKKGEVSAAEVVAFVRERVPGVDVPRIRFGIEQRFRERGAGW